MGRPVACVAESFQRAAEVEPGLQRGSHNGLQTKEAAVLRRKVCDAAARPRRQSEVATTPLQQAAAGSWRAASTQPLLGRTSARLELKLESHATDTSQLHTRLAEALLLLQSR